MPYLRYLPTFVNTRQTQISHSNYRSSPAPFALFRHCNLAADLRKSSHSPILHTSAWASSIIYASQAPRLSSRKAHKSDGRWFKQRRMHRPTNEIRYSQGTAYALFSSQPSSQTGALAAKALYVSVHWTSPHPKGLVLRKHGSEIHHCRNACIPAVRVAIATFRWVGRGGKQRLWEAPNQTWRGMYGFWRHLRRVAKTFAWSTLRT